MKNCPAANVRNFCLAGHAGAGKTTLADLILYKSGAVSRLGSVMEGTSVSDYRPEEHERQSSIYTAMLNCAWKNFHLFFTDTPGYRDFCGETAAALAATDVALIVVDAVAGIETGTISAWKTARDAQTPRAFFINGIDRDQANFNTVLGALREAYGATTCIPFSVPNASGTGFSAVTRVLGGGDVPAEIADDVAGFKEAIMDAVAESDEELMLRYLEGEELSTEEIAGGLHQAILAGDIVPVFCGSASGDIGVEELLDGITALFPNPLAGRPVPTVDGDPIERSEDGPAVGLVFKTVSDPFIGQLTYLRVFSGTFTSDSEVVNITQNGKERWGSLLYAVGKEQQPVDKAGPGEVVAVAKLKSTQISDTLASRGDVPAIRPIAFPHPTMSYSVYATKKGEEEKIAAGLTKLSQEDPTIILRRDAETHDTILSGMGDLHLTTAVNRLKALFKVDVDLRTPKVPYRETITAVGSAQYRHKKQTGGHGQFAEVHLRLEPLPDEEFSFENEVVGGNIPKNFIPAVEKGVVEALVRGPLAHCRVTNVRAVVFDGKHHPVDSSEMAFKIASRGAFRAAMANAKPQLLEPIVSLKIMFPEEYMGDITGDLNSRRGRILGMDREEGLQVVNAEAPLAETFTYSTQLRSMTQGRGSFEMIFDRYETVPANLAKQIQDAVTQDEEEE